VTGRTVTSARSARLSAVRRLAKRGVRAAERRFVAEGPQAVREALADARGLVEEVLVTEEAESRHVELIAAAQRAGVDVVHVSGEAMRSLAETISPQGILAVTACCDVPMAEALGSDPTLVAVLAAVRDPGNAGTVIRTADAAGVGAVVLTDDAVDPYNGKVVRASAGSLFHLPLVTGPSTADAIAALRGAGLTVLAADGAGDEDLDDLLDAGTLAAPTAWLFGNEAWGLPDDVRALADRVVRVPLHGRAESLNLAVAAGVCLYASARAQRARRPITR
jgi:TrmH family RNA methyltransferase